MELSVKNVIDNESFFWNLHFNAMLKKKQQDKLFISLPVNPIDPVQYSKDTINLIFVASHFRHVKP